MIGAIIGDIVGSPYEFNPTNNFDFPLFSKGATFTDDTICTIAVADAILSGLPYRETVHDWCRRYKGPKGGFGGMFLQWVNSDNPQPYNSFGNGSAMRVSPIGWLFDDKDQILEEARKSAIISHDHPDGVIGAQAIAYGIWYARHNRNKHIEDIAYDIADLFGYELLDISHYRNIFDETCYGTIPAALVCLFHSTNYESAIRYAVSLGADADTLAAIVGSIAEAYYGVPSDIVSRATYYLPKDMLAVLALYNHMIIELYK